MSKIDDDELLTRVEAASVLTSLGLKTAASTLATYAVRGGGPPYRIWGRMPLYRRSELLAWSRERLRAPRRAAGESNHAQIAEVLR
ncbi:MAG TPA: hypothetical protein VH684_11565 [Xanthobacteraceae bacterium]|jgi:hypothetical protein